MGTKLNEPNNGLAQLRYLRQQAPRLIEHLVIFSTTNSGKFLSDSSENPRGEDGKNSITGSEPRPR